MAELARKPPPNTLPSAVKLTRIHPDHARIQMADAAAALREESEPHADRPYLALNFAATLDGRITIGGRSGPIGNEADRELFHELRVQVDAVMVGAGTADTERYGRIVRDPDRRERRRAAGLEPEPLAVLVSARLSLDPDLPLLQDESSRVVIVTEADDKLDGVRAHVDYLRPSDAPATSEDLAGRAAMLPLAPMVRALRERHGIGLVMCEGGSLLAGALLREGLVDELFLSVAPKLAAGTGPTVVTSPPLEPPLDADLVTAHEAGGHLFLRYRIRA
jgi:riboflavin-specific deaminase-like protein